MAAARARRGKDFTGLDRTVLLAAVFLVGFGAWTLWQPSAVRVPHLQTPSKGGVPDTAFVETVSRERAMFYGGVSFFFGVGLVTLVLLRKGG